MPVEVESSGQVSEVLRVLRRRAAWVLVPFALITTLGTAFAVIVPKKFVSTTVVMVNDVPGVGSSTSEGREQGQVATHVIRSPKMIEAVITQDLRWPFRQLTGEERDDLKKKVLANLSVSTPNMGLGIKKQVVKISYADTDRGRAFEFLSAVALRWRDDVLESSRNAKKAEFANLTDRKKQREGEEHAIGKAIAEIHRNNEIPPWNPDQRGDRPLDPAFARLEDLRLEQAELVLDIEDKQLALEEGDQLYELMDDEVAYETTEAGSDYSAQILEQKENILELRLELERQGYKAEHSSYKQIHDEIRELEGVIRLLTESSRTGVETLVGQVPNPDKPMLAIQLDKDRIALNRQVKREESLAEEVLNLDARTKELQSVYQELEGLQGERLRLHELLIGINEQHQLMQRDMDVMESSAGNPFSILEEPDMPVRPTQPDPILIVIFSVLFSLALGLGLSLLLEYSRSCFRSINDITRVMVVPVLGTVNEIVTRRDRRRALMARLAVGGSTAAFVVTIGFLTWAWAMRPDLLTDDLRQSIDALRASFE